MENKSSSSGRPASEAKPPNSETQGATIVVEVPNLERTVKSKNSTPTKTSRSSSELKRPIQTPPQQTTATVTGESSTQAEVSPSKRPRTRSLTFQKGS